MPRISAASAETRVSEVEGRRDLELKDYHPDTFNYRHRAVCQLIAAGFTNNEIADIVGYSPAKVSTIRHDPRAQEFLERAADKVEDSITDVNLRMKEMANEMLDEAYDIALNAQKDNVRLNAAFGILDRAGYGKVERSIQVRSEVTEGAMKQLLGVEDEVKALPEHIQDVDYSLGENGATREVDHRPNGAGHSDNDYSTHDTHDGDSYTVAP